MWWARWRSPGSSPPAAEAASARTPTSPRGPSRSMWSRRPSHQAAPGRDERAADRGPQRRRQGRAERRGDGGVRRGGPDRRGGGVRRSQRPAGWPIRPPGLGLDTGPHGGITAYTNTWALGSLKPNQTKTFVWRVTAVKPGVHAIKYKVAAGLDGKAKAVRAGGNEEPDGLVHDQRVDARQRPRGAHNEPRHHEPVESAAPSPPPLRLRFPDTRARGTCLRGAPIAAAAER